MKAALAAIRANAAFKADCSLCAHVGKSNAPFNSHVPPIFQTSTFFFDDCDEGRDTFRGLTGNKYYSRCGNPTVESLERVVSDLERGSGSLAFGSGMAAISSSIAPFLSAGDHCVCCNSGYGSSLALFREFWSRFGVETSFFDVTRPESLPSLLRPNTKVLYLEIPSNPVNRLADLPALSSVAHAHSPSLRVVVDSTLVSPVFFKPLLCGADITVHSATKFINGHADVIAGLATVRDPEDHRRLQDFRTLSGSCLGPQDAFLCLRGLRTLPLRMLQHYENGVAVASFLERHPRVRRVHHAGLPSHPQFALGQRLFLGCGSTFSFELESFDKAKAFLHGLKTITIAVSLGMTDTVAEHPASMTHSTVPERLLAEQDLSPELIRMSVGLEDVDELIEDISQSLDRV